MLENIYQDQKNKDHDDCRSATRALTIINYANKREKTIFWMSFNDISNQRLGVHLPLVFIRGRTWSKKLFQILIPSLYISQLIFSVLLPRPFFSYYKSKGDF